MTAEAGDWQAGDRLVHTGKPEWGVGLVQTAAWTNQNGVRCQRLTVRFDGAGVKTLSTAFATLERVGDRPAPPPERVPAGNAGRRPRPSTPTPQPEPGPENPPDQGPFVNPLTGQVDPAQLREIMGRVPDEARDPFSTLEQRLRATLALYRYSPDGRDLLDWATRQAGLADPLSLMTRPELEQHFYRFRVALDNHLAALLGDARREKLDAASLIAQAPSNAQQALKRINLRR